MGARDLASLFVGLVWENWPHLSPLGALGRTGPNLHFGKEGDMALVAPKQDSWSADKLSYHPVPDAGF